ncbi:Variant-specific surface protein [Giardia duodenalis]|uniref:Variant-specific surface protein n=1 Tax=Giardia intestinalis TaxID=5741 RepID=V6U5P8_GIAIN|nr:Variant-specific surface protein [Giardia intestinalis]
MLAIYLAVGALAAVTCTGDQLTPCNTDQCETLGTTQICIQCKEEGKVPIDGVCVDKAVAGDKCKTANGAAITTEKVCGQCGSGYFLHSGGCYSTDAGKPGRTLCTTAGEGVCTQGAEGYFAVPGAAKTGESVVKCDDSTTGVTVSGNSGPYKGVQNCATCNAPAISSSGGTAICTKCAQSNYLTTNNACTADCEANTHFSTETPESGKKCFACGDTTNGVIGCEKCTAPGDGKTNPTCTKCTDKYLKTAADGTTTCVAKGACKDDYFTVDDSTNGRKCISCGDTTGVTVDIDKKYVGVDGCAKCTAPDAITDTTGTKAATCTECAAGFLHTLTGGATSCVETCPKGYFGHTASDTKKKTCQSCATPESLTPPVTGIEGCTSCTYTSSILKCTACGEGKKPNKEGTRCFDCSISGCAYCSGTGKCEECASGYTLDSQANTCASSSANKSGLSTGAIAGISVAAVVVVGGLVGFLCWWVVCRGMHDLGSRCRAGVGVVEERGSSAVRLMY